ncbi:MAG: hypothetical protein GXY71_03775 [Treponema sp.]|nr:hypothetical protein [Treponema sp.]
MVHRISSRRAGRAIAIRSIVVLALIMMAESCDLQKLLGLDGVNAISQQNSLVIHLKTDLGAKSIQPAMDTAISSYDISGTGPTGNSFTENDYTMDIFSRSALEPGVWIIHIKAKNSQGQVIAQSGAITVEIGEGETKTISAVCSVEPGSGYIEIKLSWPWWAIDRPEINAYLSSEKGEDNYLSIIQDDASARVYNSGALPNGKYSLSITLRDKSFGNVLLWSRTENVLIYPSIDSTNSSSARWDLGLKDLFLPGGVRNYAGSGALGAANAQGFEASFHYPTRIEIGADGTIYVCDTHNHLIRKIDIEGNVSTLAGSSEGFVNGAGAAAKFSYPMGLAVAADGTVYVAETSAKRIRKISADGRVSSWGSNTDGSSYIFTDPKDLALDKWGNLYVADGNKITRINSHGVASHFAGDAANAAGDATGALSSARFNQPEAIRVHTDSSGTEFIYLLDSGNGKIKKMTSSSGVATVVQCAGKKDFVIADDGTMFIVDRAKNQIEIASVYSSFGDQAAVFAGCGASGSVNGPYLSALFNDPISVAVDGEGDLYVAEMMYGNKIRKIIR